MNVMYLDILHCIRILNIHWFGLILILMWFLVICSSMSPPEACAGFIQGKWPFFSSLELNLMSNRIWISPYFLVATWYQIYPFSYFLLNTSILPWVVFLIVSGILLNSFGSLIKRLWLCIFLKGMFEHFPQNNGFFKNLFIYFFTLSGGIPPSSSSHIIGPKFLMIFHTYVKRKAWEFSWSLFPNN